MFLSSNEGQNWVPANSGLPSNNEWIKSLTTSESSMYAVTTSGLYVSSTNGTSWNEIDVGSSDPSWISAIALNGTGIFISDSKSGAVYLSTDNGVN
jgi:hypothetical protein